MGLLDAIVITFLPIVSLPKRKFSRPTRVFIESFSWWLSQPYRSTFALEKPKRRVELEGNVTLILVNSDNLNFQLRGMFICYHVYVFSADFFILS